jgi:Heparinase II/III N-terminus/Heparinase II/III-like protein
VVCQGEGIVTPWKAYMARALELPAHVAAYKAAGVVLRFVGQRIVRGRDLYFQSFLATSAEAEFRWRVRLGIGPLSPDYAATLAEVCAAYLQHCFDVLGSGWIQVRYGIVCRGLGKYRYPAAATVRADAEGKWLEGRINRSNVRTSRRIWRLIQFPYEPIDWQLDFRSGYRWSEKTYFSEIRYGHDPGADVKVPWELGRLQHLPQLALAYQAAATGTEGFDLAERYRNEIRNQILDFVAANPPRFGVNWACPMDVGIRVVNLLLALDLLRNAGAELDRPFLQIVQNSVREHAIHVLNHLEWAEQGRSNHYLADIVGILFAAAYLPNSQETNSWIAFATRELTSEIERQFLPDGGNFEGSTGYHRLSAELVLFGLALVLGLNEEEVAPLFQRQPRLDVRPPQSDVPLRTYNAGNMQTILPPGAFETIAKAAALARDLTKPDGHIVQWGDNDSGRLLKLQPAWAPVQRCSEAGAAWIEDSLDHRSLVAATAAVIGSDELSSFAGQWLEARLTRALTCGRRVPVASEAPTTSVINEGLDFELLLRGLECLPNQNRRRLEFALPGGVLDDVQRAAYPEFGHYVFRGSRFFLAIRCAARSERPPGHSHDDALAIELQVDGRNFFVDPGMYVYTPLPEERNRYRSAAVHSVPRPVNGTGADFSRGLFEVVDLPWGRCLYFGPEGFVGEAIGVEWTVMRALLLRPRRLVLIDASPAAPLVPWLPADELPPVCWGYGRTTTCPPRSF